MLKGPKDRDASGSVTSYDGLDSRRPLGFDGLLAGMSAPPRRDGLQIRVAPGEEHRGAPTYLIENTPDPPSSKRDQPLALGRAFCDAGSATLIENLGIADGTLRVRIRLGLPADTRPPRAPTRVWGGGGARDVDRAETTSKNEICLSLDPSLHSILTLGFTKPPATPVSPELGREGRPPTARPAGQAQL